MDHILEDHTNCTDRSCVACAYGVTKICHVCKCMDEGLATHCPGFDCFKSHHVAIACNDVDFFDGHFIEGSHSNNKKTKDKL